MPTPPHTYSIELRASSNLSMAVYEIEISFRASDEAQHGIEITSVLFRLRNYDLREEVKPPWEEMSSELREFCNLVESDKDTAFRLQDELDRAATAAAEAAADTLTDPEPLDE